MVAVTARITGRSMGAVIEDVKRALDETGVMPREAFYQLGGLYHEEEVAFRSLTAVFLAAVLLVFLLLLFLYERFRLAIAITLMPLLALSGVFAGLYLTGTERNISSLTGAIMIVGSVTEVAIFYVSELVDLAKASPLTEALIEAGKNRMRPIAMTTFAAILALLPLALGLGRGSAMLLPLA